MNATRLSILAIAGLSSVFAACGGDDLTLPSKGEPADIAVTSGNGQTGPIGSVLAPVIVQVTDSDDQPVAGVTVTFVLDDAGEGASVNPVTATTGADGKASTSVTLGTRVGPISGHASVSVSEGAAPLRADFTATAMPSQAGVSIYAGNNQSAAVGTPLSQPLVVQVTDAVGNPIVGAPVQWSVNGAAAGSVTPPTSTTDVQGLASAQWTLGTSPGTYTVSAMVPGVGTATFTAIATAGAPSPTNSTVSASPGTITAGTSTSTITVTVRDAANNPVSGASVTVSSSGSGNDITPATATTNENGVATFTFSSTVVETKTITAVAGGVTLDQTATINVQKASSTTRITSDEPDPSSVGEPVRVEFTVTGSGGGTPTGTVIVTVAGGPETCSGSVSDGFCELTLTVAGNQRDITATYQGDARFNGSSDTERHHVNAQNGPPVAAFTPPACTAGQPCPFTDSSTDPDGNIVSRTWDFGDGTPPSGETNPTHTYTAAGTYNVKLAVRDADGATNEVTHQVTVSPAANSPPVAVADQYSTPTGQTLSVAAPGVLANDTDPENNPLTAELVSGPAQGLVVLLSDGSFTYFPGGATGTQDTFTYRVSDGTSTSTATVTINIQ